MEPILTRADVLKDYSTLQLFTPLGVPYEATVDSTSLRFGKVTIKTLVPPENHAGPELEVSADTMVVVLKEPTFTPYGLVKHFIKIWRAKEPDWDDPEWRASGELLDELEALLPEVLKSHEVVKAILP